MMTIEMGNEQIHAEYVERKYRYTELRSRFLEISSPHVSGQVLICLKNRYESEIASRRELDRVRDLQSLLKILEKRDVLRYDKIEPLKQIANDYIQDPVLISYISAYETRIKEEPELPLINHYKYRGEYPNIPSDTEYLLINPGNGDGHTCKISQLEDTVSEQSLQQFREPLLNLQIFSRPRRSRFIPYHSHISDYFNCNGHKTQCLLSTIVLVIFLVIIFLVVITVMYTKSINIQSSAVDRSGFASGSFTRSETHTITIYPTQSSSVLPYTASVTRSFSSSIPDVREKVFQRISENVGRHWRDVARFLGVKESEIDSIDQKPLDFKGKAYEAFSIFQSRCEFCNWRVKMQRALEKARRKDLAEMIDEILVANN